MKTKRFKLMWADIRHKGDEITPWYYFDLDKFNELGYQDKDIFEFIEDMKTYAKKEVKERKEKIKEVAKNRMDEIQEKLMDKYVPLKKLIFEDNEKRVNVVQDFTDYSYVLASVEFIIHNFIIANPETDDHDILSALKHIRKDPLREFSHSDEDALAFAITFGMSMGLQQKRLSINEIRALLDWLVHEVEGRTQKNESYIEWLRKFFKDGPVKAFRGDKK